MKKILTTPVTTEDIKDLRVGDIIYLSGELVTGRDDVHHRVVHEGLTCPYDFAGGAVMHAGPIIREEPGKNTMISIGPTSSIRMEADAADFIRLTGVKIQVGKGGMGEKTSAACKEYGAIHCVYPGGCAVGSIVGGLSQTVRYHALIGESRSHLNIKVKESRILTAGPAKLTCHIQVFKIRVVDNLLDIAVFFLSALL